MTEHIHEPAPGTTCPECRRRVPHPRKPTSPTTKPVSYRVPLDELDAHQELRDAAAEHVGCAGQPFADFKVLSLALALVLQDASLKGFAERTG